MKKRDQNTSIMSNIAAAAIAATMIASAASAEEVKQKNYVEAHDVLLLDVSASMDDADITAVFEGVARHYLSDEAMMDYKAGICTANTVIYYASVAVRQDTHVLCSESAVHRFLEENIDEKNIAVARVRAGSSSTNLAPALEAAAVVFAGEKDALNIEATRRRVVLAGDENGGSANILGVHSLTLSSRFGATVNAVAIGSEEVKTFFEGAVVTPRKSKQIVEYGGVRREVPIAAGIAGVALNAEQASKTFQTVLSLGGF